MTKKYNLLKSLLVLTLVFAIGIKTADADQYENYFGITMTNQQYNNLLNLGFSENEIYYMTSETFEANKDINATLVATNTKYYKTVTTYNREQYTVEVTEEEYNDENGITPFGFVETTYKSLVTQISQISGGFRYSASLNWKNIPSTRSYDIMGIGFEDDITISSPVYFSSTYCYSGSNCVTSTEYHSKKKISTGGSVAFKLPSSTIISLSSNMYYDVAKATNGTITRLDMYGDYSHATSNISSSLVSNYTISIAGIELQSSIFNYYDYIPCAISTWTGSW